MTTKTDVMLARLDSILEQLEQLGITGNTKLAPEQHLDGYGNPGLVAAGELIESAWGNAVSARIVYRFPTQNELAFFTPANGTFAVTLDVGVIWIRETGKWVPTGAGHSFGFRVTGGGAGQTIPKVTLVNATWTIEESDPYGMVSGGAFTCPAGWGGRWLFEYGVMFPDGSINGQRLSFIQSGATRFGEVSSQAVEGGTRLSGSGTVVLQPGNVITVAMYHSDSLPSLACNTQTNQYFQGYYVGQI